MAIIKAEWKDNNDKHEIQIGGRESQAILTVEGISDGGLSNGYEYTLRKKKSVLHIINGESFPFSEDAVLDVSYDLRDILKTLDDTLRENHSYSGNTNILRCESENRMCRYLIETDGTVYELVGYAYDYGYN